MFIRKIKTFIALSIILFFSIAGSLQENQIASKDSWKKPDVIYPDDNPKSEASIELGSELFFETLLSQDSSISCQSCHMLSNAFADHLLVGEGIKGRTVTRNTPTLINIGLQPYFMFDGKFASLEDQVLGPILNHDEFDISSEELVKRLNNIPRYNELSIAAYKEDISIEIVQKALANFQRIISSTDSKFDLYMKGDTNLTATELEGWELFKKPPFNCIKCHSGYNFTNYTFENNGLYFTYQDSGRALITNNRADIAKFKVPSLRNIAITYPYMHNGSFKTLEEVIDHYASGGSKHSNQSKLIKGFNLNQNQKLQLIAFLNTLTEIRFLETEDF